MERGGKVLSDEFAGAVFARGRELDAVGEHDVAIGVGTGGESLVGNERRARSHTGREHSRRIGRTGRHVHHTQTLSHVCTTRIQQQCVLL